MHIIAVDDERLLLETLQRKIQEAAPAARVKAFSRTSDVLRALQEKGLRPDVAFLDIEMPGMRGLELAKKIREASPSTQIIFVTGYSEYAVEAFHLHARGYVLKPVTTERIREELDHLGRPESQTIQEGGPERLKIQCFGYFEVFWKGEPLLFSRRQTRELLAFLVDRKGAVCSSGDIITALWEEETNLRRKGAYLRTLTADLRQVLKEIGQDEVLIRQHNQWAIRPELLDCDYYRFLEGDIDAVNAYHGEYMLQYSWAEMTAAQLIFRSDLGK